KKPEPEINADAIEPDLGVGFRPVDELTQLFHGNSLRDKFKPAGVMSAGWRKDTPVSASVNGGGLRPGGTSNVQLSTFRTNPPGMGSSTLIERWKFDVERSARY